ncbi:MAG: hypothetical protein Unbinned2404contig1000_20 [Prokaryotic dsDNA virus sp.]|nr:MAG: hypothetical protein Unbinned2404contig1000_20 [Prokaryotic dsDNA virus sp.]|tara:strand:- start:6400 stop:8868 length:2469 start_codon:yes stop_codon:yes gene_type:complete
MANKYWVGNQTSGTALTANTAANWNTVADGSGVAGVPGTTDDCIFGHTDTLAANKGNAVCRWDLGQVQSITVEEGYRYSTTVTATDIVFAKGTNTLTMAGRRWDRLGFRVGMYITISGSAGNSGSFYITAMAAGGGEITINSVTHDEAAGPSVTVSSESSIDVYTDVALGNTSSGQTALALNGALKNTRGANSTITFTGIANSDTRYITNGDYAAIYNQSDLTYDFGSGIASGSSVYFDDGPYPKVTSAQQLSFRSEYHRAPTSNAHGEVTMYSLALTNSSVEMTSARNTVRDDVTKVFRVLNTSTFDYNGNIFDAGFCKWIFNLNATNWPFPVSGSTSYGANDGTFVGLWYDVVLQVDTAGFKTTIPQGRSLSLNSLKIESGAVLEGYQTTGQSASSVIISVKRPIIEGAWNFSQVADGVYSSVLSDTYLVTPSHGTGGNVQLSDHAGKFISDNDLSFGDDTLHVDRGIKITEASDHGTAPGSGYGVLWVKTTTPNTLIFTDENGTDTTLGSGGGGGSTYTDADAIAAIEGEAGLDFSTSSNHAIIENTTQDKDIIFKVNDGGASTEVLRISGDDGRIGIGGITSPSAQLHIRSALTQQPELRLENTNADNQEATIRFMKNTASPVASDDLGIIRFEGENDAGANHLYSYIMAQMLNVSDGAEAGEILFFAGHKGAQYQALAVTGSSAADGEVCVNDGGRNDINFRVEGDTQQFLLFTDAANDRVGIKKSSPASTLDVNGTIRQSNATSAVLVADGNGDISAASNLQDAVYVQSGSAGAEPFNIVPPGAPTDWVGAPPNTIEEAINRLASWAQTAIPGPIP